MLASWRSSMYLVQQSLSGFLSSRFRSSLTHSIGAFDDEIGPKLYLVPIGIVREKYERGCLIVSRSL